MEKELKAVGEGKKELTTELLAEAKRIEFPDNVISRLTGIPQEEIKKQRYDNGIRAAYKMVDTCAAEFAAETPYYYSCFGSFNEAEKTEGRKKSWFLVPARSVSDRVSSLTSAPYTVPGPSAKKDMRPLSSTITRRL